MAQLGNFLVRRHSSAVSCAISLCELHELGVCMDAILARRVGQCSPDIYSKMTIQNNVNLSDDEQTFTLLPNVCLLTSLSCISVHIHELNHRGRERAMKQNLASLDDRSKKLKIDGREPGQGASSTSVYLQVTRIIDHPGVKTSLAKCYVPCLSGLLLVCR